MGSAGPCWIAHDRARSRKPLLSALRAVYSDVRRKDALAHTVLSVLQTMAYDKRMSHGGSQEGRRKLVIGDRLFVWYVGDDPDSADMVLHVVSKDKRFIVTYHLGQAEPAILIVIGKEFPGVPDCGGCWRRFECPHWESDGIMTPPVFAG